MQAQEAMGKFGKVRAWTVEAYRHPRILGDGFHPGQLEFRGNFSDRGGYVNAVDQRARLGATATVRVPMIATTIMSSVIVKPLCRIRASSSLVLLLTCQSSCQSPRSARTSLRILRHSIVVGTPS